MSLQPLLQLSAPALAPAYSSALLSVLEKRAKQNHSPLCLMAAENLGKNPALKHYVVREIGMTGKIG